MKPTTILTFCFLGLFVSACSPYKRSFNCPYSEGKPCTSLSRIHELIDQGEFSSDGKHQENSSSHQSPCCKISQPHNTQSVPALIIHEEREHTVMLQAPLSGNLS